MKRTKSNYSPKNNSRRRPESQAKKPGQKAPESATSDSQLNARTKIVEILTRVETRQSYTDKLLEREIDKFNDADRGLITETVNGALRWQYRLDWALSQLYVGKYDNLIPEVKNNLRSAIYQLMYLDRVPPYAVLNEAVEIAKAKFNQKTANLVNAILRNYLRQAKKLEYIERELEFVERMAVSYSHPHWMIQRWIEQWGVDDALALCEANNKRPRLFVRINQLQADQQELFRVLDENQVKYDRHPDFPEFLYIHDFSDFRKLDLLKKGWVTVQDCSTGIPVRLLDPQPGEKVLDMCAAPGGKATFIAELMQNKGTLFCLDKHPNRARLLRDNFERMGIGIGMIVAADALHIPSRTKFDRILLDAPCSGFGVLSKRVDLKWKRKLQDIKNMHELQFQLLSAAADVLADNGTIVYSTCTIEVEENEAVVERFLKMNPDFAADDLREVVPQVFLWDFNSVRTFSHRHQMDGSYAVRLRKAGA